MSEQNEENKKVRILFVEDDSNLSMVLKDYLEMIGYEVDHGKDGEEGLGLFKANTYDIAILDIMMPKKDGFTLATEIKQIQPSMPLILLTAKNQKEDKLEGFNYGCDDYITKPFSTEELNLRVKAILKRCNNQEMTQATVIEKFKIGKFNFDSTNLILSLDGDEKRLTRKESSLLKLLCINKNELLAREVALETVWGENDYFIGRSMDVFIAKLRKYLKADPNVKITNVHGIGFKLEIDEE
ncbi:MAG: DNA-binding response regulator [Marinilabiliales bacterium]|nr:MAG: DNA-binding response regulator [Marinilabiliales bacterium]